MDVERKDRRVIEFIGSDYREPLTIPDRSVDLLISLFSGFIWGPCQQYMKLFGYFLVYNSHGDAGIALLDRKLKLIAVIDCTTNRHRLSKENSDDSISPKNGPFAHFF